MPVYLLARYVGSGAWKETPMVKEQQQKSHCGECKCDAPRLCGAIVRLKCAGNHDEQSLSNNACYAVEGGADTDKESLLFGR